MRKVIGLSIVLLMLVGALVSVSGCGGGSATEGSTKAENGSSELSEAELEALTYPGAQKEDVDALSGPTPIDGSGAQPGNGQRPESMPDGSAPPMSSAPGAADGPGGSSAPPGGFRRSSMLAAYWTSDSIDKVSTWYEQQLSGKNGYEEMATPSRGGSEQGASVKMYTFELGETSLMLMVRNDTRDRGGTVITMSEAPEGMPARPMEDKS